MECNRLVCGRSIVPARHCCVLITYRIKTEVDRNVHEQATNNNAAHIRQWTTIKP